jgi:catechol 2,3-dioxygenase-like lactoylglutathione lyase family enzyme
LSKESDGTPWGAGKGETAAMIDRLDHLVLTVGDPILPRAAHPRPGSADCCLIADRPLDQVIERLGQRGISIELGPVVRTGATGPLRSIYLRDPDGNLVDVAECG